MTRVAGWFPPENDVVILALHLRKDILIGLGLNIEWKDQQRSFTSVADGALDDIADNGIHCPVGAKPRIALAKFSEHGRADRRIIAASNSHERL